MLPLEFCDCGFRVAALWLALDNRFEGESVWKSCWGVIECASTTGRWSALHFYAAFFYSFETILSFTNLAKALHVLAEAAQCPCSAGLTEVQSKVMISEVLSLRKLLGTDVGSQTIGSKLLVGAIPWISARAGNRNPGVLTSILDVKSIATFLLASCSKMTFSWRKVKCQQSLFIAGTVCWRWPLKESFEEQTQQCWSAVCCWWGLEGVRQAPLGCGKWSPKGFQGDAPSPLVRKWKRNPTALLLMKMSARPHCKLAHYMLH